MPTEPPATAPVSTPTLKDALREARDELIQLTKLARGGFAAAATYSDRLDDLIRRIYATARNHTDTPHAIAAVGGYGRKHMCLHSDVDLLIVFDGSIGAPRGAVAEIYPASTLGPASRPRTPRTGTRGGPDRRDGQPRVSCCDPGRPVHRRRCGCLRPILGSLPSTGLSMGGPYSDGSQGVGQSTSHAVQPHAVSPRTGHQGRAGGSPRRIRHAYHRRDCHTRSAGRVSGGAARGGRGLHAADSINPAP